MTALKITFAAILSWTLLSVVSRVLLVALDLDPWLFSFIQLVSGGVALLLIGYRSGNSGRSFYRKSTWLLGALRVLSASLYAAVLALVSVLEAGIVGAINLPILAVLVFIISRKRPYGMAWIGYAIALLAAAWIALDFEDDLRIVVFGLMTINATCLGAMNLIAEQHPENQSASLAGRAWFSGVVLAITALLFLVLRLAQADSIETGLTLPLILSSIVVGVFLRAPSMFLTFWALSTAGAQSYTAAIAFLPLFGTVLEQLAVHLGLLDTSRFQIEHLYMAGLTLAGSLVIWWAGQRNNH